MHLGMALAMAAVVSAAEPPKAPAPDAAAPKVVFNKKKLRAAAQLGNAKEEEPACPPAQPCPKSAEADTALARALLYAFEPAPDEIRVIAIEDLALLGDARALNPLATLVLDSSPSIQFAALRAVSHFQTPRAEEILENVVRHPRLPDLLKVKAVQALPFQASATAHEFLMESQNNIRLSAQVRSAARSGLQDWGSPPPGS